MASSLGKMPTTSVRRLISPLTRSIGLVLCSLVRCAGGVYGGEKLGHWSVVFVAMRAE
jgi:hypothetical protein